MQRNGDSLQTLLPSVFPHVQTPRPSGDPNRRFIALLKMSAGQSRSISRQISPTFSRAWTVLAQNTESAGMKLGHTYMWLADARSNLPTEGWHIRQPECRDNIAPSRQACSPPREWPRFYSSRSWYIFVAPVPWEKFRTTQDRAVKYLSDNPTVSTVSGDIR
jgi:hypothetical protein